MSQADALRSPITTASKKKHLAEITQLLADAAEIQNLKVRMGVEEDAERYVRSEDGVLTRTKVQSAQVSYAAVEKEAIKKAQQFGLQVRRLLRIFHRELPDAALACADAQVVQLFTENDAEGERLLGRFWITDVWDSEPGDPIDRRSGIDMQAVRDATAWLDVLAAKLELNSCPSRVPKDGSATLANIRDNIRVLRDGHLSCEEICKRLDEKGVGRPPNARWRELTWWSAWKNRKYRRSVKSSVTKFTC